MDRRTKTNLQRLWTRCNKRWERVLIKLAVEKSRKIILAWERCCFSQWLKWLGTANPSICNERWTYDLLVTCPDAVPAELQETCGNKTCCILLGLDVTTLSRVSTTTHPLYREARRTREERGSPTPSPVSVESSVLPCTILPPSACYERIIILIN